MKETIKNAAGHRLTHILGALSGAFFTVIVPALDMLPPDARAMKIGSTSIGSVLLLVSALARIIGKKPAEPAAPPDIDGASKR